MAGGNVVILKRYLDVIGHGQSIRALGPTTVLPTISVCTNRTKCCTCVSVASWEGEGLACVDPSLSMSPNQKMNTATARPTTSKPRSKQSPQKDQADPTGVVACELDSNQGVATSVGFQTP